MVSTPVNSGRRLFLWCMLLWSSALLGFIFGSSCWCSELQRLLAAASRRMQMLAWHSPDAFGTRRSVAQHVRVAAAM